MPKTVRKDNNIAHKITVEDRPAIAVTFADGLLSIRLCAVLKTNYTVMWGRIRLEITGFACVKMLLFCAAHAVDKISLESFDDRSELFDAFGRSIK